MSEFDDYNGEFEQQGITQSELDTQLEGWFEGFYLDYILPLEKQVRELGGTPKIKDETKYGYFPKLGMVEQNLNWIKI